MTLRGGCRLVFAKQETQAFLDELDGEFKTALSINTQVVMH